VGAGHAVAAAEENDLALVRGGESDRRITGASDQSNRRRPRGFFKGLALLPSLIGVRNNPNDAKLQDVLPADLYARWKVLKEKYIGRDNDPEKWRPIFAAFELYSKAIDKSGMATGAIVWSVVEKAAKKKQTQDHDPHHQDGNRKTARGDQRIQEERTRRCRMLCQTIERLETDLDVMRGRANAWRGAISKPSKQ